MAGNIRRPLVPRDTASGVVDLTLAPGAGIVAWAGSTPAVNVDKTLTPAAATVAWTGSTPAVTVDKTVTPGTSNVAWSGSTPGLLLDITRQPGTPNVTWAGSTPAVVVDKTPTPGTATVAWSGSTPSVILEGAVTLSPGTPVVAWTGSTPSLLIVPDFVPEPETEPDTGGGDGFEDFSTVDVRSLTLAPGVAVVAWTGSRPDIAVVPPLRVRLPRRRERPVPGPERVDLGLSPGAASVAFSGSPAPVRATSLPSMEEMRVELASRDARLAKLERRLAALEEQAEEEALILAALSAD